MGFGRDFGRAISDPTLLAKGADLGRAIKEDAARSEALNFQKGLSAINIAFKTSDKLEKMGDWEGSKNVIKDAFSSGYIAKTFPGLQAMANKIVASGDREEIKEFKNNAKVLEKAFRDDDVAVMKATVGAVAAQSKRFQTQYDTAPLIKLVNERIGIDNKEIRALAAENERERLRIMAGQEFNLIVKMLDNQYQLRNIGMNNPIHISELTKKGMKQAMLADIPAEKAGLILERGSFEKPVKTLERMSKEAAAKRAPEKPLAERVAAKAALTKAGVKERSGAQNFMLPDDTIVLSFDRGRTYKDKDGEVKAIPFDAIKIPGGATLEEINLQKAKTEAEKEIKEPERTAVTEPGISPEEAALGGTGPFSKIAAFIDSTLGGFLGAPSLFPETQENRQQLKLIKQIGKEALIISSRGAIWEQEKIDQLFPDPSTFFANPRTEVKKFKAIRNALKLEKDFNNQAIATAITVEEAERLRQSNQKIDRLFAIIGTGEPSARTTTVTMPDGSRQVFDSSGKRIQ